VERRARGELLIEAVDAVPVPEPRRMVRATASADNVLQVNVSHTRRT
jgi:hypothetical protein